MKEHQCATSQFVNSFKDAENGEKGGRLYSMPSMEKKSQADFIGKYLVKGQLGCNHRIYSIQERMKKADQTTAYVTGSQCDIYSIT